MSGGWIPIIFFVSTSAVVWGYFFYTYKAKAQQQETFWQAYRKLTLFSGKGTFQGWLFRIAYF